MRTDELTTRQKEPTQAEKARRIYNSPAAPGNAETALLHIKYTMLVCACAIRCEELNNEERDAIFLLLEHNAALVDVVEASIGG